MKDFGPKRLSRILFVMYYCVNAQKTRRQLTTAVMSLYELKLSSMKKNQKVVVAEAVYFLGPYARNSTG